jgi:N-acetylglutamate synthase-like GNAT family acetyltransferase
VTAKPTGLALNDSGGNARPALAAGTAGATARRQMQAIQVAKPKSRSRQRPNVRASAAAVPAEANSSHAPVPAPAPAMAVNLSLRPFTYGDETFITQVTQQEIAGIFKECYGYDLDMNMVLQYVQAANTRIVTVDGQTAGYLSLVADDMGKMNIGSLVLAAPHQGKGYGKRIMRLVEQEARAMGMQEMEVFIQKNNNRSIEFARSLGFTEAPSNQEQTVVMVKSLRPPLNAAPRPATPQPGTAGPQAGARQTQSGA